MNSREESAENEYVDSVPVVTEDVELGGVGAKARELDRELTARERFRLPPSTLRRLGYLAAVYGTGLLVMSLFIDGGTGDVALPILPGIVFAALLFELLDSSSGMGFGTTLAPVLFLLGYDPLQVAPVLLLSETLTGFVSGGVHHELDNVSFSIHPPTDATKLVALFAAFGAAGSVASIVLTYFVFSFPAAYIETYVMVLVLAMGLLGLVRSVLDVTGTYNPQRLVAFAFLAGVNKGIGGGGFGPVITVGQILSGVYEKSATGIASLAESFVSLFGLVTFLVLADQGVGVDLVLFPSIYVGGFIAAIGAPYLVRVVPNRVWSVLIP
jgi:uncharacterized membrane protein YfcA